MGGEPLDDGGIEGTAVAGQNFGGGRGGPVPRDKDIFMGNRQAGQTKAIGAANGLVLAPVNTGLGGLGLGQCDLRGDREKSVVGVRLAAL